MPGIGHNNERKEQVMRTKKKRIAKTQERRQKIEELTLKSPEEIENAVLPTVTDIYSHADFSRRRKENLLDVGQGQV